MEPENTGTPDAEALVTAVSDAYERAASAIEEMTDAQAAFGQATRLADLLRQLADEAAKLRARSVTRIWESEEMSLAALASRIGVAKSRADQLIRAARADKKEKEQ